LALSSKTFPFLLNSDLPTFVSQILIKGLPHWPRRASNISFSLDHPKFALEHLKKLVLLSFRLVSPSESYSLSSSSPRSLYHLSPSSRVYRLDAYSSCAPSDPKTCHDHLPRFRIHSPSFPRSFPLVLISGSHPASLVLTRALRSTFTRNTNRTMFTSVSSSS
jgi:hypothetical protein